MNCDKSSSLPMFLAGLGTGVALALLLAPLSGDAARNLIRRRVTEGGDWVRDQAKGADEYVRTQGSGLLDKVNEVAEVITRA